MSLLLLSLSLGLPLFGFGLKVCGKLLGVVLGLALTVLVLAFVALGGEVGSSRRSARKV